MKRKVEYCKHNIGKEELARVERVFRSLFLTTGDEVGEFEQGLASYLGLPSTVAVTSCTAAMQLALLAAGIPAHAIHDTGACTACESHWYFSHRRDAG